MYIYAHFGRVGRVRSIYMRTMVVEGRVRGIYMHTITGEGRVSGIFYAPLGRGERAARGGMWLHSRATPSPRFPLPLPDGRRGVRRACVANSRTLTLNRECILRDRSQILSRVTLPFSTKFTPPTLPPLHLSRIFAPLLHGLRYVLFTSVIYPSHPCHA